MAQKVSIARHQGLLSLLLKEVQETLKGRQNTAGPVWEEHRRISGYRPSSGASRSRPSSGNSRGRGRRQPAAFSPYFHRKNTWTRAFVFLAFSEQNALPSTSERITLTLNGLTSVIDCGTPSKPPPKCTKCCSICCKRKLTKSSVSSLGDSSISPIQKRSSIVYRKILKISPTKYKPPKPATQKTLR